MLVPFLVLFLHRLRVVVRWELFILRLKSSVAADVESNWAINSHTTLFTEANIPMHTFRPFCSVKSTCSRGESTLNDYSFIGKFIFHALHLQTDSFFFFIPSLRLTGSNEVKFFSEWFFSRLITWFSCERIQLNDSVFERDLMCTAWEDGWNKKFNSFSLLLSHRLTFFPLRLILRCYTVAKVYHYINIWNRIVCKCLHLLWKRVKMLLDLTKFAFKTFHRKRVRTSEKKKNANEESCKSWAAVKNEKVGKSLWWKMFFLFCYFWIFGSLSLEKLHRSCLSIPEGKFMRNLIARLPWRLPEDSNPKLMIDDGSDQHDSQLGMIYPSIHAGNSFAYNPSSLIWFMMILETNCTQREMNDRYCSQRPLRRKKLHQ